MNEELHELAAALERPNACCVPGGRLVVVSFHSLEDRIVKSFLAARGRRSAASRHAPEAVQAPASFRILTGRPVMADEAEIAANPRARSAKLRAAERTDAPAGARHRRRSAAAAAVARRGHEREAQVMMRLLNILRHRRARRRRRPMSTRSSSNSTRQAERLAKLRMEIRQEQDAIAALRAEWSKLDSPGAHPGAGEPAPLTLKPIDPRQFDTLRNLPERPPDLVPPDAADPIGSLLENPDVLEVPTASIPTAPRAKR